MIHLLRILIVIGISFFPTQVTLAQKKFELKDYAQLVNLSDPQVSADGENVLLIASIPDYNQNIFKTRLVMVETATGKTRTLVTDKISVSNARWSPRPNVISFLAKESNEKSATPQLYFMYLNGDSLQKITNVKKGVQHYSWSPVGDRIAFVTADEPENKDRLEKGFTDFEVKDNDMFLGARPLSYHIWMYEVATAKTTRITSGSWSLPVTIPPGPPSCPISWSPDGQNISFLKVPSPYSGESLKRTIQLMNLTSSEIKSLTSNIQLEAYPVFSPDGKSILYWYKKGGNSEDINDIRINKLSENIDFSISSKLDRDLYRATWMPDGKSIICGGHDDNKTSLWQLSLDGSYKKINLGAVCPAWSFWVELSISSKGEIVFIGTEPGRPAELYYLASPLSVPQRLSEFNKEVAAMMMGKVETIRWKTDGLDHNGIVTIPVNYDSARKYPLVLIIHGGPAAASVEQFSRLSQLFANEGYFVFEPNYRGSDNMGSNYKLAIVSDAAPGPGRDVMDGVGQLRQKFSIDSTKMGVTGWSYGGFMTVWLSGHYPVWAAAMAGAAVTDLADQYNLSDYSANRAAAMGGSPWIGDNMKRYIDQSPITEARNIKAPTLILANTGDPRVPVNQSYKLYHAIKDNGTKVKFIAWPINAHNATDPITQMERDRYWTSWMNEYLKK